MLQLIPPAAYAVVIRIPFAGISPPEEGLGSSRGGLKARAAGA